MFDPPVPLAPQMPLATLTNFRMWSPEGRSHGYWTAPNLPPSFPQLHRLFVTEDLERCISPGESEGSKLRRVKTESRQSTWRLSFSPVTQHLMTQHVDRSWAWPHGSRIKMCHQKSCGNVCVLYSFVSFWVYSPLQQVAGQYSNIKCSRMEPSELESTICFARKNKRKEYRRRSWTHWRNKNPKKY